MIVINNNSKTSMNYIFRAFCLIAFLSLSAALTGCSPAEKKELKAPLRQVRSMVLSPGSQVKETSFSGRLHAVRETSLSFKVGGNIRKILVNVGDPIKKGEVIASLDPSTYALAAQQSKATWAEAKSNLRNAKSEYDRVKKLYIGGNESKSALDNARAAFDSAQASVQATGKALEIDRLNLSYTHLIAEEECAIASVDAEVGENVAQGTQVFYTTCGSGLEVKLDIPEKVISDIKKGMKVGVTFSAFEGETWEGIVNEVGVTSVSESTTYPVTVMVTDARLGDLKAGLSAEVYFSIAKEHADIVVPAFALGEDQSGRFAFVLDTTREGLAKVKRQPIVVGNALKEGIEVLQGLVPGMRVVTAGVSVLREGMEVKYNDK